MTIKERIEKDLKTAMLAGDKVLVTTLRGLKSAILYAEVASSSRDTGLPEEEVVSLLQKEAKKRQESATMYRQGDSVDRAEAEEAELVVIQAYLPAQLSEEEIQQLVTREATKQGITEMQQMGQLIGAVKKSAGGTADGAVIARLAKEYLSA